MVQVIRFFGDYRSKLLTLEDEAGVVIEVKLPSKRSIEPTWSKTQQTLLLLCSFAIVAKQQGNL